MNDFLVNGDAVWEMIPQKPPMVMIDKIITVSTKKALTAFTIKKENIFCEEGLFQAAGLTENMAQTAAAQVGYLSYQAGEKPPVGFIGAIKNLEIEHLPKVGTEIHTSIEIEHEIMGFTIINAVSKQGEVILASCQMKIFIAEKEDEKN